MQFRITYRVWTPTRRTDRLKEIERRKEIEAPKSWGLLEIKVLVSWV